jgi:hypothetical protein
LDQRKKIMTAVQELTKRLNDLPDAKREAMAAALLEEMNARNWDREIAEDYEAGKLDHLIDEAKADMASGRTKPL